MPNTRGTKGPAGTEVGQIGDTGGALMASAGQAAMHARPSLRDTLTQNFDRFTGPQGVDPGAQQTQPMQQQMPGVMPDAMQGSLPPVVAAELQQMAAFGVPITPQLVSFLIAKLRL